MMPPPTTSPPTPRRLDSLHRVLIVLVLVAGVVGGVSGYFLGNSAGYAAGHAEGRAPIREASLLVSVMNEMPGTITVQLFLNGDPAGACRSRRG